MALRTISSVFLGVLFTTLAVVSLAHGTSAPFELHGNRIIDQSGSEILVSTPFKKIISLYGAHTENLFALGCDEEIIGVTRNAMYPAEAQKRPAFHYREDAEKFLAARPDLILIRPMIARGYPQLVERLQKSGITVVSLQPSNVEEMFLYWRILGLLTGRGDNAEAMVETFQNTVTNLRAIAGKIKPKKRVYFESIHGKMKTFSPDSMAIFALECAGGINLAADAAPARGTNIANFGKEKILAMGNDIDVYLAQVGPMNRPTIESICNEPGFQAIKAVRTGDIHLIDETIVSRPTLRLLDGITKIGEILYPSQFGQQSFKLPKSQRGVE
jgi:ABC-type Fe3+-hydroxamate transport system substrate-binding protein